jgi:hypothetical protein
MERFKIRVWQFDHHGGNILAQPANGKSMSLKMPSCGSKTPQ